MSKDYRDKLQDLLGELHTNEGVTRYRISKKSGISEQTISNVMHKRRNLSIEALEKLLESIGYEIQFVRNPAIGFSANGLAVNGAVGSTIQGTGAALEADTTIVRQAVVAEPA